MKTLTALCVCTLLLPNAAIAQINRSGGTKTSNLGTISASNDYEARRLCTQKGGNIVVKSFGTRYTCYYTQLISR